MKIIPKLANKTKRHLCASGSILLPLAQKWGLVGVLAVCGLSLIGAGNVSAAELTITIPDNKYWPGPTSSFTTLDNVTTTEPITNKSEKQYAFTIATKVDNTIAAGTYTGTFTFTAVANTVKYTINYDANKGADAPKPTTGETQERSVKLANSEPKKSGDHEYVFLGWCDKEVSADGTCDGMIYQANEEYNLKSANENTTLYAMWDWITMQNWDDCPKNLVKNKQFTLMDSRDNRAYFVAKLADGNCWMTENLDLDLSDQTELVPENTDIQQKWTPKESTHKNSDDSWRMFDYTSPQSADPGDLCWDGKTFADDGDRFVDCSKHEANHYHIGNYYTFTAAVAQNDTSGKTNDKDSYESSICPSGWQLPNLAGSKSYTNLITQVNISDKSEVSAGEKGNIHTDPYFFIYAGFWHSTFKGYDRWYAAVLTNAVYSPNASYAFTFGEGAISTADAGAQRHDGFNVRCVARE